jgi:hypothetical protein
MGTYKALVELKGAPPAWRTVQANSAAEAKALLEAYGRVQMVPTRIS